MSWTVPGYVEIKDLGRGASGRVVLAEHEASGTNVAIKYLADHLTGDPEFAEAFRAEARILSEVEDPQIARLYEYVESPEGAAIVMELVDGVALRAILREHGPTEPQSALVVLKGSLLGLAAAHGRSIVHRDYKPENVLVNQEGQSKLADFGIAARTGLKGAHAGTPSYMAPEQWAGAPASPSTDIYAATATFFECLTGHPPYRAPGDVMALRSKHEQDPVPVDEVPEAVRGLVRRGLAKKWDQRPKDAGTFLVELEAVAGAGYGPDWEEEGRGALARRAALLLLLFPLAGAAAGGTGLAQTVLGWSKKSMNTVLAGGLALAIAIGGFFWYQTSQGGENPAAAVLTDSANSTPSPSPTPEGIPSPSADPALAPTATASPIPGVSTSPPRPSPRPASPSPSVTTVSPPPPPPPSPNSMVSTSIAGMCWYDAAKQVCSQQGAMPSPAGTTPIQSSVRATSRTGEAYNLKFTYTLIQFNGNRTWVAPLVHVPAGNTSRTTTATHDVPARFSCSEGVRLVVQADIPGDPSKPAELFNGTIC
ncbi:MAG TPA: serine/threonine-protein kinase [Candidatus Limnocylindrales bacterium]